MRHVPHRAALRHPAPGTRHSALGAVASVPDRARLPLLSLARLGRSAGGFVDEGQMWGLGATEWFLLIVVVILIPLGIAVTVTRWSLEQARQRTKRNRSGAVRRVALPEEPQAPSDRSTPPEP
jgi:hypothetical protein